MCRVLQALKVLFMPPDDQYGTQVVGGVTPGKGGTATLTGLYLTLLRMPSKPPPEEHHFVPQPLQQTLSWEAADAGIRPIVCNRRIPVTGYGESETLLYPGSQARLVGPNCPGFITAEECKVGIMPGFGREGSAS